MATLPDYGSAIIPEEKLRYCLDPAHSTGRHKARVFKSALGLDLDGIEILERMLRQGISSHDAEVVSMLTDGTERWVVEWIVLGRLAADVVLSEEGEAVKRKIVELDVVEITSDLPQGFVEGARGTVVAVHGDGCTVEFLDPDGYTIGLFEIPMVDLEVIEGAGIGAPVVRED
ncbi:MAG: DUF4926 domain-containing protein [Coriobacteriia bacterium]